MPLSARLLLHGWRAASSVLLIAGLSEAANPRLQIVDDLGKPVPTPLEVCFQVGLGTDCRPVGPGESVPLPASFFSLRIAGEDYGPVVLRREDLLAQKAPFRAVVARKGWLHVEGGNRQEPLVLSLYRPDDPMFREPAFRHALQPGESEVKVPSGEFIASLSMARNAPDLVRWKVAPGGRSRLLYKQRPGWSLIARFRDAKTHERVGGVQAKLAVNPGYGQEDRPLSEGVSSADGLVLFSGLEAPLARMAALRRDFIPTEVNGLTAGLGTFSFREVDLEKGGRLAARVTVHGRPFIRSECRIYALAPEAGSPAGLYRQLWAGKVDHEGRCHSDRLAQGVYKLQVRILDSTAQVDRWVNVPDAQEIEEDVALVSTRITGEVRRGGRPVPGYNVQTFLIGATRPPGARGDVVAEATSDESGKYEMTVWLPGHYGFTLLSPAKTPVAGTRELTTEGDDERKVDFDLDAQSVRGQVIDLEGHPVEKANVALRWWAGLLLAATDGEGKFEIDVDGEGPGTLVARKAGFRESDPAEIQVTKGSPLPPVTLVMNRKETLQAKLLSASGMPIPGAWLATLGSMPDTGPFVYRTARGQADGTFEIEVPTAGPVHLLASGPGCPLTPFDLPSGGLAAGGFPEAQAASILRCQEFPAAAELTLLDETGAPVAQAGVILRLGSAILPQAALAGHLQQLGLPAASDGAGHLVLAGLAPGDYEIFLNTASSESTIAAGLQQGYLTSIHLDPLSTTEVQLTLPKPNGLP